MAAPNRQTVRIQRDIDQLQNQPLNFIQNLQFIPSDPNNATTTTTANENLNQNQLTGTLIGPEGSDYEGGRFDFTVVFPAEYPFRPPEINLTTPIIHPNVDTLTGMVCHDRLIGTWTAKVTLSEIFTQIHNLLAHPNYETPIQGDKNTGKTRDQARESARRSTEPPNNA